MPLFKHMDGTAAIEEAAKRNHIMALEKSAENKVGLYSCRMCRTLASVLAFLYRRSLLCLQVNVQHVQSYIEPGCAFCILPQRIEGLPCLLGMFYFSDIPLYTYL